MKGHSHILFEANIIFCGWRKNLYSAGIHYVLIMCDSPKLRHMTAVRQIDIINGCGPSLLGSRPGYRRSAVAKVKLVVLCWS